MGEETPPLFTMKITYKPLPENGEQITKYGVSFKRDQTVPVEDEKLAARLLTNAYFVEAVETEAPETTKRTRRTRAEMEALRNEDESTGGDVSPPDDEGG